MKSSLRNFGRSATLTMALAGAFWAGTALASREHLDEAHASVSKALQALKAAQASDGEQANVSKAVGLLTRAEGEIIKAKQAPQKAPEK